MTRTSNNITEATAAAGIGPRRARNLAVAFAAALAVAAAAPAASFAADGFTTNTTGTTANSTTQSGFGTTVQANLPSSSVRLYVWTNQASGGTLNLGTRRVGFDLAYDTGVFEILSGGTTGSNGNRCGSTTPATNYNYRATFSYAGGGSNRSCFVDFRVKSGVSASVYSKTLTWAQATSGACQGGTCSGSSGGTTSGSTTFSATVQANNPSISLSGSGTFSDTIQGDSASNKTITVTNNGNVPVANPSTQSITGTNADQFSIVSTTCGTSLAVNATCEVVVKFSPTSVGAKAATLNVTPSYSSADYGQTLTLSGTGTEQTYTATIQETGGTDLTSYSGFADTIVGNQSLAYTFNVNNTGNKPMTFASDGSSVALSGDNAADYAITATTCDTSVAAGSSCTVTVRFNPSTSDPDASAGTRTATITVTPTNASDGTNTIATADSIDLSANAVAQTRLPGLYNAEGSAITSYDYGNVAVGVASPITFTLKNDGNFTVQGTGEANQSITGDAAADYAISSTTCGTSLGPGASCEIVVAFTPSDTSARNATLSVGTADGNGSGGASASIYLTGVGTSSTYIPELYESDGTTALSSHAFDDTIGTQESATYTFTLRNAGTAVLEGVTNQSFASGDTTDFTIVSTTCAAEGLNPNSTCDITVRFTPGAAGDKSAVFRVDTTNGTPDSVEVTFTGKSIQAVQTPTARNSANDEDISSHSFADTIATQNSATYNVTIKNTGNVALSGIDAGQAITGADADSFSITATTCGASIAVGSSCTITVRFNPSTQGAKTANLVVTPSSRTNVNDSVATVALSGTALEAKQTATLQDTAGTEVKESHAFADTVETTNSATYVFTLRNTGNVTLNGAGSQTLSGPNSGDFSITATTCGVSLAPNATCTITTRFNPQSGGGPRSATLNVNVNSRDNVTTTSGPATLTGTSIPITRIPSTFATDGTTSISSYEFPATIRTQSSSYTVVLKNTGNYPLNGTGSANQSITGTGAVNFSITSTTCGTSLAVNASCNIVLRFLPTTMGNKSATLKIDTTDGTSNDPAEVSLSGAVIQDTPELKIFDTAGTTAKTSHDFATVNVGSSSAYTFVLKNTGNVPIGNPNSQAIGGADTGRFARTSTTCSTSLAVNATCNIVVTYTPNDTVSNSATLDVIGIGATLSFPLTGSGGGVILSSTNGTQALTGSTNHRLWLDSLSVGARSSYGDTIRAAWTVGLEPGRDVTDVLVSSSSTTNDTAPADSTFAPVTGLQVFKQPGGSNRQFVSVKLGLSGLTANGWGTGISDGLLNLCISPTTNTNNRRVWFKIRDDQGKTSSALGTIIRVNDSSWACSGSYTMINDAKLVSIGGTNVASGTEWAVTTPGTSVTWSFQAQRKGTAINGLRWRIRNSETGQMFTKNGSSWTNCGTTCTSSGNFTTGNGSLISYSGVAADTVHTLTTALPSRGRWVVEGVPLTGSDNAEPMQFIGRALVNTNASSTDASSSPTISVAGAPGDRPATNSSYTLTATVADPSDPSGTFNSDSGAAATVEWDLDNNPTNGPAGDGFESRSFNTSSAARTRSLDLTGKTPGSYTVRARVTDNGGASAADPSRASKIWSKTFTVNTPPVPTDQTVDIEADEAQPRAITLAGTDANGDALTFTVPSTAGNGTLGGSGASRTYSWDADYTGKDTYTFVADDGLNATGSGTLTVRVRPNTTIDTGAPTQNVGTKTKEASFTFSSPQVGVVGYECRLTRDSAVIEDWASCSGSATGDKSYSDLADGVHKFEVRAKNADDQVDGTPASWTWRVDNTAPVARVLSGPPTIQPSWKPRPTNDTTPAYRFDVDDRSAQSTITYECRWKGSDSEYGEWVACGGASQSDGSGTAQLIGSGSVFGLEDPLVEGDYTFQFRATDEAGNLGEATTETFRIDTTPASTAITNGPEGLVNIRDLYYTTSSTEPGSSYVCKVTGENSGVVYDGDCQGEGYSFFVNLADDEYTVQIAAKDPATNVDPNPATVQVEIDATVPTTTLLASPPAKTKDRRAGISFSGSDSRALKGFECRLDSTSEDAWEICSSPETYSGLADGDHKVEVRAVDQAGNRDASPVEATWNVDETQPNTTINSAPDAESPTDSPTVTFSASESSTFECSLDGGAYRACTSPLDVAAFNGGPLADGGHRLLVRATDVLANLESTPALASWRSDTVAPSVVIHGKPTDPSPKGDAEIAFALRDGSPATDAPELDASCKVDDGDWAACTSPLRLTNPAAGSHTVSVRTTDAAGNTSAVVSWTWTVISADIPAPVIADSQPANGATTSIDRAQISFSHANEGSFTLECRLDDAAWGECSPEGTAILGGLSDGLHTFEVRASDAHGNHSPAASVSWTVVTAPPGTNLDGAPSTLTREPTGRFRFSSNRSGATFECRLDRGNWTACESPYETAELANGRHRMEIRALHEGTYDPTPVVRNWTVDNVAPETQLLEAPDAQSTETDAKFAFRSNDRLATFQCKIDARDYQSCASPTLYTRLAEGAHQMFIRAVDPAGNRDDSPVQVDWQIKIEEDEGGGPVTGNTSAVLTEGGLVFPGLSDQIPLPAGSLTFVGDVDANGAWTVSKDGATFPRLTQAITAGGLNIVAKITISASGGSEGQLPRNGGPASLSFPAQLKVAVETDTGAVLIGESAGCYLRPIDFRLTGTYNPTTQLVTLGQASVGFPKTSAGCGTLGATVDAALGLPRNDISISTTFRISQTPTAGLLGDGRLTGNVLRLPVSCPKVNVVACSGVAQVTTTAANGKTVVLGKSNYSVNRGTSSVAGVTLPNSVLDAVRKAGAKGLPVKVTLTPNGVAKSTFTKAVRLYDLPARKRGGAR